MTDERRREDRVRLPMEARYEGLSGKSDARVYDISSGGCYIESVSPAITGETLRLEILLPSERWLVLHGEVVHHEPGMGFGLRFGEQSNSERDVIAGLIEYGRGD